MTSGNPDRIPGRRRTALFRRDRVLRGRRPPQWVAVRGALDLVASCMAKHEKTLLEVLRGGSDANIEFADLRGLLLHLGFEERVRGSHHVFFKSGIEELINVQRAGSKAKPYQVRQVRAVFTRHGLGGQE